MQLDRDYKGFSFMREGPLDMRMNPSGEETAWDIVNKYSEQELGKIFRELGEEKQWRKIAKFIVTARKKKPINTTKQLADLIMETAGYRGNRKIHPATLVFQALRIAVNNELESIRIGLAKAITALSHGGVMAVLSFHSLEDRIVKHLLKEAALHTKAALKAPLLKLLSKKPIVASAPEQRKNPRSRSAKLRVAQKL